jgi:hypothetical protein
MEADVSVDQVKYVLKLGQGDNPKRVRIAFFDETTKHDLMKKRKIMKGKKTWLADDLIHHTEAS